MRPVLAEFAGTPNAGKTTYCNLVANQLGLRHIKATIIREGAELCPIQNRVDPGFNVWTFAYALKEILQDVENKLDVILVDRGLYDFLFWVEWFKSRGQISGGEQRAMVNFALLPRWNSLIDTVFVCRIPPAVSVERNFRGSTEIVSTENVQRINRGIQRVVRVLRRTRSDSRLVEVDGTGAPENIADYLTDHIEEVCKKRMMRSRYRRA